MVEASNDFDSTDHQGGMWWPHVLPGNGLVSDKTGTMQANHAATTYRVRSGYTSWGTHSVFSVPNNGGTTSQSTPTVGGVMALVLAYGRASGLTGPESVQVVRATASDVDTGQLPWPTKAGWDLQTGVRPPQRVEGDAGGVDRQHPACGLDRLARLVQPL